ncbi:MAG TPA: type IV secretion system protein VirB10 [Steroidobacteraceae bacterium]|nr:type IV secretion system protein VirB10 [Steroidobacteraceae bacterium]
MSRPDPLEPSAPETINTTRDGFETVPGERTVAAVHRVRSLESRVSHIMAVGLMCTLGFGLLVWYYGAALRGPAHAAERIRSQAASRAQGEMPLPSLGVIVPPALAASVDAKSSVGAGPNPSAHPSFAELGNGGPGTGLPAAPHGLGALPAIPATEYPRAYPPIAMAPGGWNSAPQGPPAGGSSPPSAAQLAFVRRLSGPVFARQSDSSGASAPETATSGPTAMTGPTAVLMGESGAAASPTASASLGATPSHHDELTEWLTPSVTPAALAHVLPTQRLLLPKGAFIDCTLETAIDSTLPGMTTCITATDTFSADGTVVLLERGSKLVGETRGEVQQGSARVFVLWTEARTPTGVVIPLASPGTDELGRSGVSGEVDRHFWERFGAAILISIIDAGGQAAVQSTSSTIIYNPTASQDVMADVLKDTLRIPPTVVKSQGDRIQVLVARDLDFRSVYELRTELSGR